MTNDEKLEEMRSMLGVDEGCVCELTPYLHLAKNKILNRLYPFAKEYNELVIPTKYEYLQIELAITLYNMKGVEGQSSHSENGVSRSYRDEIDILSEITPMAGLPL